MEVQEEGLKERLALLYVAIIIVGGCCSFLRGRRGVRRGCYVSQCTDLGGEGLEIGIGIDYEGGGRVLNSWWE